MPEVIDIGTDVGYTFNYKSMNNCGKPQVDVAATIAQSCKITQTSID